MNHLTETKPWPIAPKPSATTPPLFRVSSTEILQGRQEVEIEHNGMLYRMRCTSLGKLILTK